jgi:hypothetical protein
MIDIQLILIAQHQRSEIILKFENFKSIDIPHAKFDIWGSYLQM